MESTNASLFALLASTPVDGSGVGSKRAVARAADGTSRRQNKRPRRENNAFTSLRVQACAERAESVGYRRSRSTDDPTLLAATSRDASTLTTRNFNSIVLRKGAPTTSGSKSSRKRQEKSKRFLDAERTRAKRDALHSTSVRSSAGRRRVACAFFARGSCTKGSSCPFSHDEDDVTASNAQLLKPCVFFFKGKCSKGDACMFSHETPVRGTPSVIVSAATKTTSRTFGGGKLEL